ncbi:hypothetical protein RJ641_019014 [Dillenia turbinata]|uniref:Uncharacterized protein n=1 Tax=Dillenia turbinata TaxID=194707 RepID=A0AAN8UUK1_9MAGN
MRFYISANGIKKLTIGGGGESANVGSEGKWLVEVMKGKGSSMALNRPHSYRAFLPTDGCFLVVVTCHYPCHFLVAIYFAFGFVVARFFFDKFFFRNLVIIENLGKALLLGNYARFLNGVLGDLEKAEEYFEKAIL